MPSFCLVFDEYPYEIPLQDGIVDVVYPYLFEGKYWLLAGISRTTTEIGKMCKIHDDELIILKLKYGG